MCQSGSGTWSVPNSKQQRGTEDEKTVKGSAMYLKGGNPVYAGSYAAGGEPA